MCGTLRYFVSIPAIAYTGMPHLHRRQVPAALFQLCFLVFQPFRSLEQVICKDAFFDCLSNVGKAVLHFIVLLQNICMIFVIAAVELLHLLIYFRDGFSQIFRLQSLADQHSNVGIQIVLIQFLVVAHRPVRIGSVGGKPGLAPAAESKISDHPLAADITDQFPSQQVKLFAVIASCVSLILRLDPLYLYKQLFPDDRRTAAFNADVAVLLSVVISFPVCSCRCFIER